MTNPYCISFDGLRELFQEQQVRLAWESFTKWSKIYTREEFHAQVKADNGPIVDELRTSIKDRVNMSEYTEIVIALQLADFYFPDGDKQICFEIRRGVDPKSIKRLEDLVAAFEDATHIDCLVQDKEKKFAFQIKRYRGDNTARALIDWIKGKKVFKRYGNMSGTILVVVLQSISGSTVAMDLGEVEKLFTDEAAPLATFDEVELSYTVTQDDGKQYTALHKLLREHKRLLIPLDWALGRLKGIN